MPTIDNTPKVPAKAKQELGQSGTLMLRGFITQEEYNLNLVGKRAIRIYDTMRRSDATTHAALQVCKLPILSAPKSIEPASDDEQDQFVARFVERELFHRNVNFHDTERQGLTFLDFGHSLFEKVYGICEFEGQQLIGLEKLGFRKQISIYAWAMQDGGEGITQQLAGGNVGANLINIPKEKLIILTNDKEGDNFEGISLLRYAYKHWNLKDKLEIVNAIALEKQAIGVPILRKNQNNETTSEPDLAKARAALREFRGNEEAFFELADSIIIEMLDMKSSSNKEVLPTLEYEDKMITLSVLAQFLMLGSGKAGGSRALSQDHSDLFTKALNAVAHTLDNTYQEQLVKQLCDLNFTNLPNGYPTFKRGDISERNIEQLATAVSSLVTSGALTPDPDMENDLRQSFNLPDLPEEIYDDYANRKPVAPIPAPAPTTDKTKPVTEDKTIKEVDDQSGTKTKASAIRAAKEAERKLIEVIYQA